MFRILFAFLLALITSAAYAQETSENTEIKSLKLFSMGAGPVGSSNYIVGGALCSVFNRQSHRTGYRCLVDPTEGVINNFQSLKRGDNTAIIVPSDWQYYATKSLGYFQDGFWKDHIRSIVSLHPQAIYVVAHPSSGIEDISDLEGKNINLGPKGSGHQVLSEAILKLNGFSRSSFKNIYTFSISEQIAALCFDNSIDAFIFTDTVPSSIIRQVTLACGAKLIPLNTRSYTQFRKDNPFFVQFQIPENTYAQQNQSISTLAFMATVVTTDAAPQEAITQLAKSVVENLDILAGLSPLLQKLDMETLVSAGVTARRHIGADIYFRKNGLL